MKTAFINGIILDGTKEMIPVVDKVILVEDKKIVGIEDKNIDLSGYEIIDLKNKYIMPGLINLHVHLAGNGKPKKKPINAKLAVKVLMSCGLTRLIGKKMVYGYAKQELLSGVTTIRTVGGVGNLDSIIRDDINKGKLVGPRLLAANKAISVPGGHMAGSLAYEATNEEEAIKYVDLIAKDKPDLIKLMITGGVMDAEVVGEPGVLRMDPKIVKAACDRAHELGFMVAAHVESPKGLCVALENGVDSIEHGAKPDEEIISLFKARNAFQVSTISPAVPYAMFDRSVSYATYEQKENGKVVMNGIIDLANELLKNDIPVGLGTDTGCPYITQYDFWREVYYFTKFCNVSNSFALYNATLLNAKLVGIDDITGSIQVNKFADMIVTSKNPLDDLTALRNIDMVVKEGFVINNPVIKKNKKIETELDKFL